VSGHDDDLRRLRLIELTHQLDALAIRKPKVRQKDVGTLSSELDPRIAQAMSSRDCKALHARNFLQPVHDIRIVVDYQSMCHVIPWTEIRNRSLRQSL